MSPKLRNHLPDADHVACIDAAHNQLSQPGACRNNDSWSSGHPADENSSRFDDPACPSPETTATRHAAPNLAEGTHPAFSATITLPQQTLQDLLHSVQALLQQVAEPQQGPPSCPPSGWGYYPPPPTSHQQQTHLAAATVPPAPSPSTPPPCPPATPPPHTPPSTSDPPTPIPTAGPPSQDFNPATAMRPCLAVSSDLNAQQARGSFAPDWLHCSIADATTLPGLRLLTVPLHAARAAYGRHYKFVTKSMAPLPAAEFLTLLHMNACTLSAQLDRTLALMPRLRRVPPTDGGLRGGAPAYFDWRRQFLEFLHCVADTLEAYFLQRVSHGVMEYRRVLFTICRRLPRPLDAIAAPAVDPLDERTVPLLDVLAALDGHFCPDQPHAEASCGMQLRAIRADVVAKRVRRVHADFEMAKLLDEYSAGCEATRQEHAAADSSTVAYACAVSGRRTSQENNEAAAGACMHATRSC